jgi:hypothetical protein
MSSFLKSTFLVFGVLCLLAGAALLLAPGRSLGLLGWEPVDPLLTRLLGAALLGMAWGAWRVFRKAEKPQVSLLVELFCVFSALSTLGLVRHLVSAPYPLMVWILSALTLLFAILWAYHWLKLKK